MGIATVAEMHLGIPAVPLSALLGRVLMDAHLKEARWDEEFDEHPCSGASGRTL